MLVTKTKKMKKILIVTNGSVSSFMPNILSGINLKEKGIEKMPFISEKKDKFFELVKIDRFDCIFIEKNSMDSEIVKELLTKISNEKSEANVYALKGDPLNPMFLNEEEEDISFKEFIMNNSLKDQTVEVE